MSDRAEAFPCKHCGRRIVVDLRRARVAHETPVCEAFDRVMQAWQCESVGRAIACSGPDGASLLDVLGKSS